MIVNLIDKIDYLANLKRPAGVSAGGLFEANGFPERMPSCECQAPDRGGTGSAVTDLIFSIANREVTFFSATALINFL